MIADDDKDRVRAATSIVDLVSTVTTVRRTGRTMMAVCPFHEEKTASMSLDVARGLYYCHGCHASGDVFTFIEETQGAAFPEALEILAERAGITLHRNAVDERRRGDRRRLVEAVRSAVDFYHRTLMSSPDAGQARGYLRGRGYGAEVVADFKLGYAPRAAGSDALVRQLRAEGVEDRTLVDAGLARRGRTGLYDEFRERVLFPIFDVSGDPVGFGGRILGAGQPKYINTPETRLYKKSRLLYGLDRARSHIGRVGYAVVVEGYTDVIACHRAGLPGTVATCGTALGEEHFDLLRRFTERIVLAFDTDAAGIGAALRGDSLETPVRLDLDLRVADLPAGIDPADLVGEGRVSELVAGIEGSRPLLQFRIERELERVDLSEPESRARAVRQLAPRIARISDELARGEYVRFLADRAAVPVDTVERALGRREPARRERAPRSSRPPSARPGLERELLRAMLADGAAGAGVEADVFADPEIRAAFETIATSLEDLAPGTPVPIMADDPDVRALLLRLATDREPPRPVGDVLGRLRSQILTERIEDLRRELTRLESSGQDGSQVAEELIRLQRAKRDIEGS